MTVLTALTSFAVVAGMLTLIPGMDTAVVLRFAVTQGQRYAFAAALGVATGSLVWGAAAAVGVSAVLTASHLLYTALRVAGAGYMIWLGAGFLRQSLRRRRSGEPADATPPLERTTGDTPLPPRRALLRCWTRGLATNLANPKTGVFYLAMLPQFIPAHAPHLLMGLALAAVHDLEGLTWFTALILGTRVLGRWLRSGAVHRAMDRITGTVLIGFGVKLALADN
ncbi:LysE family translocator [Kitasatospora sp. LaBMicrA B282]|uniref:LysE family translocator n=1 Tax=Kitasatospora sp. LaBMicrA B282 TaxID=3420949 RepID=UPI003D0CBA86